MIPAAVQRVLKKLPALQLGAVLFPPPLRETAHLLSSPLGLHVRHSLNRLAVAMAFPCTKSRAPFPHFSVSTLPFTIYNVVQRRCISQTRRIVVCNIVDASQRGEGGALTMGHRP